MKGFSFICRFCLTHFSPSFKESHVEWGRVEVDKLEDEHLHDEGVVILGLCSVHLCNGEKMTHCV